MNEYSFKPALLGAAQVWTIKDGHVLRRGGTRAVDLSKIQSATWGDMAVRGTRSAWLYLKGDGEPLKIVCNDSGGGNDRAVFLDFVAAISDELNAQNTGAEIRIDGGAGFSMAMFVIGVFGLLGGLFFVLAGAMDWVKRGHILAIVGGLAGAGFMGWLAWSYAPWRQVAQVSAKELGDLVRLLRSGNA